MGRITINPYEKGPKKSLNKDIKTQDKEIEITSNGTTEITPDEGFAYLNKVSVKTNVAQSGEGGGSAEVIPTDVVWDCNTDDGCKEAFEALWKLCERYDGKFNTNNPMPLYPWYNSIDMVKFGAAPTHIYNKRDDGDYQYIFLDQYNELVLTKSGESYNLILN